MKFQVLNFLKFSSTNACVYVLNILLLIVLVDLAGFSPLAASLSRTTLTNQLRFALHRLITGRKSEGQLRRQWWRFQLIKLITLVVGQGLFWLLTATIGLHYLAAYVTYAVVLSPLTYLLNNKYVYD